MFANDRRMKIVEVIERRSSITVSELIQMFGVSIETIRRDLEYLEKKSVLKRVHGGAVSNQKMNSYSKLENRISENKALKQQVAKFAVQFIQEHDIIAIDSGSTAMELVPFLREQFQQLTIVTNSPEVFQALCDREGFEMILIGGQYLREEKAFYGHIALDMINRLHFSKSFIFPSAVSLKNGIGVFVHELYDIQRAFLNNADEVFILTDSTKFEKSGKLKLCEVSRAFTIITDGELAEDVHKLFKKQGIRIINELKKE